MTDTLTDKMALELIAHTVSHAVRFIGVKPGTLRAIDHIAARLAQTAGVPEVSGADVKAAWEAFDENVGGKTMFAALESYRARLLEQRARELQEAK